MMVATALTGLSSTGCLVLGEPDFREPVPTTPILSVVNPPNNQLLILEGTGTDFDPQEFVVNVVSEDAGQSLERILLLDYGVATPVGQQAPQPYAGIAGFGPDIDPGTATDLNRDVALSYPPQLGASDSECHTITFQVYRKEYGRAPYDWCPSNPQFARVTWLVALCEEAATCDFSQCPDVAPTTECPAPADLAALEAE